MRKIAFGFAVVLVASAPNLHAGGYDTDGLGESYFRLERSAAGNLAYLNNGCVKGRSPLAFGKEYPYAFGIRMEDEYGHRHHKIIPLADQLVATSPEGETRRFTYLSVESGRGRIISKTIFVDKKWAHENVVRIKWYDADDTSRGLTITKIKTVSNAFPIFPEEFRTSTRARLCSQLRTLWSTVRGEERAGVVVEQPAGTTLKIEISR